MHDFLENLLSDFRISLKDLNKSVQVLLTSFDRLG